MGRRSPSPAHGLTKAQHALNHTRAAIGLTVPGFTRIQPRLVPAAAVGLMLVTLCATILHASRGEVGSAVTTLVLLLLATFVAYGRWKRVPIAARV